MREMKASTKLKRAKRRLMTQGWCQGAYRKPLKNGVSRYCMIGALRMDAPIGDSLHHLTGILSNRNHAGDVVTWNDTVGRRLTEVLWIFDWAIAIAEGDGQ